ncbi:hypothetical protein GCM10009347_25350 [Shewanella algicola]|uniref:Glycosyl transferase family 1 domain-containing protein n=1 Tax=Shewanella algicola TaxID=640633 RepID=A0A9X2CED4_9GAMM|nr:hypothetical protein [Shewanella algicola]MCL1106152.1 hypothetical protein [Shewanella algicola]GGP57841.1 hypothetical protein GCM10009347_25350 [Shewanella algicola]
MNNKVIFVGHFSNVGALKNSAASPAGDIVQQKIIDDSKDVFGVENFYYLSMEPRACWPKGSLFENGTSDSSGCFISFFNLPIIKNLIFSLLIFYKIVKERPHKVIVFNNYPFESFFILFSSFIVSTKTVLILQDLKVGGEFSFLSKVQDYLASKLARFYKVFIPVSSTLTNYLKVDVNKEIVFKGGVTDFGFQASKYPKYVDSIATFAGALEKHNGIDKLIKAWSMNKQRMDLHIFGRGSLQSEVLRFSNQFDNIIYHGLVEQDVVLSFQMRSKFNFCLRYSEGINEKFFFPSKFFNVSMCPGAMVCNDFYGLPNYRGGEKFVLNQNLSNLNDILSLSDEEISDASLIRKDYILLNHTWKSLLTRLV